MITQVFNINMRAINRKIKKNIICQLYFFAKAVPAKADKIPMHATICIDTISFIKIIDSLENLCNLEITALRQ